MVLRESALEGVVKVGFWHGKRVFVTGHTGFKGSWLTLWLLRLGASVTGFSLTEEPTGLNGPKRDYGTGTDGLTSLMGDIQDFRVLRQAMEEAKPEIVFHLAAQPLVRESYCEPLATLSVNVIGTAHVLEAVRTCPTVRAVVNVTSDKCYENKEWLWPYRESDPLGGYDPYSASKACAELVSSAYRQSFYNTGPALATVRSGNVIGGGDWAKDRLVPDLVRAIQENRPLSLRKPVSVRPWQHVLEPLSGYLQVAERLCGPNGKSYAEAWNFGPDSSGAVTVGVLAREISNYWNGLNEAEVPGSFDFDINNANRLHEAGYLTLDCAKARFRLGWTPKLTIRETVRWTVDWYRAQAQGANIRELTLSQIIRYEGLMKTAAAQTAALNEGDA